MLEKDFITASANITELDSALNDIPIARKRHDNVNLKHVMSNTFGFGGTNGSILISKE